MTTNRQEADETRAGVSISEMARMVGLSRQRFHQLVQSGVFPQPKRDEASGRPYYDEPTQQQCLEVRRRNCGVNGQVVLFYAQRQGQPTQTPKARRAKVQPSVPDRHADILDGLKALGMTTATTAQVSEAVKELYPQGADGTDLGEVIRSVFIRLRVKNTAENVGRQ